MKNIILNAGCPLCGMTFSVYYEEGHRDEAEKHLAGSIGSHHRRVHGPTYSLTNHMTYKTTSELEKTTRSEFRDRYFQTTYDFSYIGDCDALAKYMSDAFRKQRMEDLEAVLAVILDRFEPYDGAAWLNTIRPDDMKDIFTSLKERI